MTKKDRIALVLTSPFLIAIVLRIIQGGRGMAEEAAVIVAPVVVYWGYRFIKGDISFMKQKEIQNLTKGDEMSTQDKTDRELLEDIYFWVTRLLPLTFLTVLAIAFKVGL